MGGLRLGGLSKMKSQIKSRGAKSVINSLFHEISVFFPIKYIIKKATTSV